jgi:hypothetical protein
MKAMAIAFAIGAVLLLPAGFSGAQAAEIDGQCKQNSVTEFISSDVNDKTSSTDWVDVSDAKVNFKTEKTGCIIITFSAPAYAYDEEGSDYNTLHVRTLLDGSVTCVPDNYIDTFAQAQAPVPASANSITRVCYNVGRGRHEVQVQYRNDNANYFVNINSHVLTVAHR